MHRSIILRTVGYLVGIAVIILPASCKKQKVVEPDFAVLQLFGAIEGDNPVVANFSGTDLRNYLGAYNINEVPKYEKSNRKYIYGTAQPFSLHIFPDTLPGHKPLFSTTLELEKGKTYSFFAGGPAHAMKTIFIREDSIPVFAKDDSSTAFRFVNFLSQTPLSINITGQPYGSLVSELPFGGITGFIRMPVPSMLTEISIEFRHAVTHELMLLLYDDDVQGMIAGRRDWLFKPRTIMLTGIPGVTFGNDRPLVENTIHY